MSDCLDKQGRSVLRDRKTVSSNSGGASLRPQERTILFTKCSYDKAANKVTFSSKSSRDRDAAKAQCMASSASNSLRRIMSCGTITRGTSGWKARTTIPHERITYA